MAKIFVVVRVIKGQLLTPLHRPLLQLISRFKSSGKPQVLPRFAGRIQVQGDALGFCIILVFFGFWRYISRDITNQLTHRLESVSFMPIHPFFFLSFGFLSDEIFEVLLLAPHQLFEPFSLSCQKGSFIPRGLAVEYFLVDPDFVV